MSMPTNDDEREIEEVEEAIPPVDGDRRADRATTEEDPDGLEDARHAAAEEEPPIP